MKNLDLEALAEAIQNAHLEDCIANECNCVTVEEHAAQIERAQQLGLTLR